MDRIDDPTAAPGGLFTEGDPATGVPATVVRGAWLNGVQEELIEVIEAAGLVPTALDLTQLRQAIALLAAPAGAFKNRVINGDLALWQRGSTFTSIGPTERYTADRWAVRADGTGGGGLATVTRQGFAFGQQDVPGARYHLRYQQTTAPTAGGGAIATKLEDLELTGAREVTVSLWAKAGSATNVTLRIVQDFGATEVVAASTTLPVATAWGPHTLTATLPSVVGQSPQAGAHLRLELVLPASSGLILDVARVQLELGSLASSFEARPDSLELMLCQRYYEKSYDLDTVPGSITAAGAMRGEETSLFAQSLTQAFRVRKRTIPTLTFYSPLTGLAGRVSWEGVDHNVVSVAAPSATRVGMPSIAATIAIPREVLAHFTADAEL